MEIGELLKFVLDKDIIISDDCFFHATRKDISIVRKILEEGIKAAYLRGKKGNHFNGKYYISLFKNDAEGDRLLKCFYKNPKFVISDVNPYYADRQKLRTRRIFINTRIPLRTSEWDGEYQQYLEIPASKFVALEYSLSYLLSNAGDDTKKIREKLEFLKAMILCLKEANMDLPVYDLSANSEINKEKVLSLSL